MAKKKAGIAKALKEAEPKIPRGRTPLLPYGLMLAGLPISFAWLLRQNTQGSQGWLFCLLLACLVIGWGLRRTEADGPDDGGSCLSGVFLHGCLLMVLLIAWNYLFRVYLSHVDFTADIFRTRFRNLYAPLYGYYKISPWPGFLYPLVPGSLFAVYLWRSRQRAFEQTGFLFPAAFLMLFAISMALTDGTARLTDWISHYGQFAEGLPFFSGLSELLANYTDTMSRMGVHNNHYPPGVLMLLKIEELLGLKDLTRIVVMLSSFGTLWVLDRIGNIVGGANGCSQLAVWFFVFSPGILVYTTVDPGFVVILLASLSLSCFLQGMLTGKQAYAISMGLMFALYTFFSFSSGFLALLFGVLCVLLWRSGLTRLSAACTQLTLSIACFTAAYICLYYLTGFNLLVCFKEAVRNNTAQMSHGFDDGYRYLLRSTGALLVYLVTVGFPQSYLTGRTIMRAVQDGMGARLSSILAVGVGISLLIASFSGFFFLETERIWLFFTPAVAVAAGCEANLIFRRHGFAPVAAMLLCSMLLSVVYELFLQSFAWR